MFNFVKEYSDADNKYSSIAIFVFVQSTNFGTLMASNQICAVKGRFLSS